MQEPTINSNVVLNGLLESLCNNARVGLVRCYGYIDLPHTTRLSDDSEYTVYGNNTRYSLICQISLSRWLKYHSEDKASLPNLWPKILAFVDNINNVGDVALMLWAAAESRKDDCSRLTKILVKHWSDQNNMCNAVELGWVVQSMVSLSEVADLSEEAKEVLKVARERLLGLYNRKTRLFARHNRSGIAELLSLRVACFADQVYPILALANYGRVFNDAESIEAAVAAADTICRLQGPMGQWWWHYDALTGKVAEEYPVFSVHQHGMAPMALFAIDAVAGTNHKAYIEKGLVWLDKQNELNEQMIEPDKGIIWRDIHRREIGKMFRVVRGLLITMELDGLHRLTGRSILGYVVNRECRPYELGWLLYAWAPFVHKAIKGFPAMA